MFDVGFTFTDRPQFGLYSNCPFIAPGGYSKVDGHYVGLGGGKIGVMEHHQDTAGLFLWGREDVGWGDPDSGDPETAGAHQVGPLGLATDPEGNPTYKPQCAHYLHLGFVGVTGNLNYKEWADFFLGWFGVDISDDDGRALERPATRQATVSAEPPLSRALRGLQLVVRTDKDSYTTDEPVVLDVRLYNRTGRSDEREDLPRDLSVYFEPFARNPRGRWAEWLFKFYVFELNRGRRHYSSPRFDVPADHRDRYYHHVTLPPNAFVGRRFVFPAARTRNWLEPGRYILLVTYEVSDDYRYVIINRDLTVRQAKLLGRDIAYTRVWTGRLISNVVAFRVQRKKRFALF